MDSRLCLEHPQRPRRGLANDGHWSRVQEHSGSLFKWYQRDVGGEAEAHTCAYVYAEGVCGEHGTLSQLEPDYAGRLRLHRMVRLSEREPHTWSAGSTHAKHPVTAPISVVYGWL